MDGASLIATRVNRSGDGGGWEVAITIQELIVTQNYMRCGNHPGLGGLSNNAAPISQHEIYAGSIRGI